MICKYTGIETERERETDSPRDRVTETETDRQAGRQAHSKCVSLCMKHVHIQQGWEFQDMLN